MVPKLRSNRIWMRPTVITGIAVTNRKEVTRVIQMKGGILIRVIPGALMLMMVTRKLNAPASDDTPNVSRPRA